MADECQAVEGGWRLRCARSNATLLLVISAIEANPSLRFHMTFDEAGACWVDVQAPRNTGAPPGPPRTHSAKPALRVIA